MAAVLDVCRRLGVAGAYHPHWDVVDAVDLIPYDAGADAVDAWPGTIDAGRRWRRLERFLGAALAGLG